VRRERNDLTVVADRGYFNGPEILECDQAGMTPFAETQCSDSRRLTVSVTQG
jgi:hypothetical protein